MGGRRIGQMAASIAANVVVPVAGGALAGYFVDGKEGMKRGAIGGLTNFLMLPGVGEVATGLTMDRDTMFGDKNHHGSGASEELGSSAGEGGKDQFGGALGVATSNKRKRLNTLIGGYSSGALSSTGIGGTSTTLGS